MKGHEDATQSEADRVEAAAERRRARLVKQDAILARINESWRRGESVGQATAEKWAERSRKPGSEILVQTATSATLDVFL